MAAQYRASLKASTRRSRNKRRNKLAAQGEPDYLVCTPDDHRYADLVRTGIAMKRRWLAETGRATRALNLPNIESFLCALTNEPDGRAGAVAAALTLDGRPIAVEIGFVWAPPVLLLAGVVSTGNLRDFSPGKVQLENAICWCIENGITHYDLLGDPATYKSDWSNGAEAVVSWRAAPTLKGRMYLGLWHDRLLPAAKASLDALPPALKQRIIPIAERQAVPRGMAGLAGVGTAMYRSDNSTGGGEPMLIPLDRPARRPGPMNAVSAVLVRAGNGIRIARRRANGAPGEEGAARSASGDSDRKAAYLGNAGMAFLIRIAGAGLGFGLQVLLARTLALTDYGLYVTFWTWLFVAGQVSTFGFNDSVLRFLPRYAGRRRHGDAAGFLRAGYRTVIAGSLAVALAGLAGAAVLAAVPALREAAGDRLVLLALLFAGIPVPGDGALSGGHRPRLGLVRAGHRARLCPASPRHGGNRRRRRSRRHGVGCSRRARHRDCRHRPSCAWPGGGPPSSPGSAIRHRPDAAERRRPAVAGCAPARACGCAQPCR